MLLPKFQRNNEGEKNKRERYCCQGGKERVFRRRRDGVVKEWGEDIVRERETDVFIKDGSKNALRVREWYIKKMHCLEKRAKFWWKLFTAEMISFDWKRVWKLSMLSGSIHTQDVRAKKYSHTTPQKRVNPLTSCTGRLYVSTRHSKRHRTDCSDFLGKYLSVHHSFTSEWHIWMCIRDFRVHFIGVSRSVTWSCDTVRSLLLWGSMNRSDHQSESYQKQIYLTSILTGQCGYDINPITGAEERKPLAAVLITQCCSLSQTWLCVRVVSSWKTEPRCWSQRPSWFQMSVCTWSDKNTCVVLCSCGWVGVWVFVWVCSVVSHADFIALLIASLCDVVVSSKAADLNRKLHSLPPCLWYCSEPWGIWFVPFAALCIALGCIKASIRSVLICTVVHAQHARGVQWCFS